MSEPTGGAKKTGGYVALLRGINVGGSNIIKMDKLRACFEQNGFQHVSSYIQSGNVLFESAEQDQPKLENRIEEAIFKSFKKGVSVVVRSGKQMKSIVSRAPKGFGSKPDAYRYDVIFLKAPLTPKTAMEVVSVKKGVDQAYLGNGVLYFSRLISKAAQSKLTRIIGTPEYKFMTIRNWNTTVNLLELLKDYNILKS
ncbi:MAG: DUF1697 domain-containing protein [Ignavibacteriales bacterium]|nr:DUF1697 domain-containing protein [Ignavibacteriales bacterium]